jgi:hypothetical protein
LDRDVTRAAASDARAPFHCAGTAALAQIVFLPVSLDMWNHELGAASRRSTSTGRAGASYFPWLTRENERGGKNSYLETTTSLI